MARDQRGSDDDLVRQTLRDVLADPKTGFRVKAQAARTLARMNGSIGSGGSARGVDDDDAPYPMADLWAIEYERRARAVKRQGRRQIAKARGG